MKFSLSTPFLLRTEPRTKQNTFSFLAPLTQRSAQRSWWYYWSSVVVVRRPSSSVRQLLFKSLLLLQFLFDNSEFFTGETRHIVPPCNKAGISNFCLEFQKLQKFQIAEIPVKTALLISSYSIFPSGWKVSMLTRIYPHKARRNIEVIICKITRLTAHFLCGLMSDLLISTCL